MPLKILIPHNLTDYENKNSYLKRFINGYKNNGIEVVDSLTEFFYPSQHYDIMHIHFLEHIRWFNKYINEKQFIVKYLNRLKYFSSNSFCIWSVHNTYPHRNPDSKFYRQIYQETINHMDIILHHCESSKQILRKYYVVRNELKEYILPHGAYSNNKNNEISRKSLKLSPKSKVFLFIGQIDEHKGIKNVFKAYKKFKHLHKGMKTNLIICGWKGNYKYKKQITNLINHREWIFKYFNFILIGFFLGVRLHLGKKEENQIADFVNIADVIILGHKHILTSGVAALVTSFNKVAVAPKMGCLSEQLSPHTTVFYEANNIVDFSHGMYKSCFINSKDFKDHNYKMLENMDWEQNIGDLLKKIKSLNHNKLHTNET